MSDYKPGSPEWKAYMVEKMQHDAVKGVRKALAQGVTPESFYPGITTGKTMPKRKQKSPEGDIQRACLEWLRLMRVFHWRQNNLPTPLPGGGFRPVAKRGLPDIMCCIPDKRYESRPGVMVGIEVKSETGKQSPDQVTFQQELEAAGGRYYLVRSVDDLTEAIKPLL